VRFGDLSQRRKLAEAGIGEQHIDTAIQSPSHTVIALHPRGGGGLEPVATKISGTVVQSAATS